MDSLEISYPYRFTIKHLGALWEKRAIASRGIRQRESVNTLASHVLYIWPGFCCDLNTEHQSSKLVV